MTHAVWDRSGVEEDVRGALRLRRWAVDALGGTVRPSPDASIGAWGLFLEGERCSLPLHRAITRFGELDVVVPINRREQFDARLTLERARVEAARRHLEQIAAIAREHAFKVVVLKAGAAAHTPHASVDMEDLDVLVPPESLAVFVRALDGAGYRPVSTGASARHLASRTNGDLLKIDVHYSLDMIAGRTLGPEVWGRCERNPASGLWVLGPRDHLDLMIRHVVLEHPNRRSNLRELCLLVSMCGGALEERLRVPNASLAGQARADALDLLRAAVVVAEGSTANRLIEPTAGRVYAVRRLLAARSVPPRLEHWLYTAVFALVLGETGRRSMLERLLARGRSQHAWLARIQDRFGIVGSAAGYTMRFGLAALSLVAAVPAALAVAWVVPRSIGPTVPDDRS